MRRKSDRSASKKSKSSPEKKLEKVKRTRGRRRKQSSSSDNESTEDVTPALKTEVKIEADKKSPQKPATTKEDSPEETQEQVWHVKPTETSGDIGEIKKLKICLSRPSSTPERTDRSPRSKRKHSRATSSSDTPSVEGVEDRKKSKHRSKRSARESKEESEKNDDSHEEPEYETEKKSNEQPNDEITQSVGEDEKVSEDTPMSTTNEEIVVEENKSTITSVSNENTENKESLTKDEECNEKTSDADTTVVSPKTEIVESGSELNTEETVQEEESSVTEQNECSEQKTESTEKETNELTEEKTDELDKKDEESIQNSLDVDMNKSKEDCPEEQITPERQLASRDEEVSKTEDVNDNHVFEEAESTQNDKIKTSNENDVVERSDNINNGSSMELSIDSSKDKDLDDSTEVCKSRQLERTVSTNSTQSVHEENLPNGQAAPIVINRKRRWGSRHSQVKSQKSIAISTDVLKDIIPDVKPVEFEEVIEEKKHKQIKVSERIERPVLPKIVIDNTENVECHRKENEEKDKENVKMKETHLSTNRKISIVKDSESIIARPPSPPRHKQSNILFITNLVRPFTLPQLKNLLQRTGRIVDNGFWIDKIKSKCFIIYETEDQAVETRHALHGVTWPVSNPKTLQVDFSTQEAFDKAKLNEDADNAQTSTIPGTVEDWLREQDMKRERGDMDKPWDRKAATREWDVGKNEKDKEKLRRDDRPLEKRRHRTPERSPEPARKFKKKEEEAPAKLLDDLFRKTKATPCIYWLPLSAETIAVKEEQRRQHMAEHERRLQELRRTHRRH